MALTMTALTTSADRVSATLDDQIVSGTAETLNVSGFSTMTGGLGSDSLSGGGGYDVLALTGAGAFNLAGVFQLDGFEEVRLTNATLSPATLNLRPDTELIVTLSDGSSAPASPNAPTQAGSVSVALSNARVTVNGGNESDTITTTAGTFVAGSQLNGGGGFDQIIFYGGTFSSGDTVYDLTSVGLRQIESISASDIFTNGRSTTLLTNAATLADVRTISLAGNAKLSTAEASFDLRGKTVVTQPSVTTGSADNRTDSRFPGIVSTNTGGTTFTVDALSTALAVQGGAGNDTLVASNLTLNQAQRDQIFTGSVETIQDATGTYVKPTALPPGASILTTRADEILAQPGDQIVFATAETLNVDTSNATVTGGPGSDSLSGGSGYDVLALSGAGSFNLGRASLDGFEEVRLTNATLSSASLTLRPDTELTVTLSDGSTAPASPNASSPAGSISVALSNARVTVNGGNESDTIIATADTFVAGSQLNGGGGFDQLSLSGGGGLSDTIFDLSSIGLSQIESVSVSATSLSTSPGRAVAQGTTAALADVRTISLIGNAKLSTAEVSFDLRGKTVVTQPLVTPASADNRTDSRFPGIMSTNTGGTTFTVDALSTALVVQGGAGNDTLVASNLTLNQAQREQIFTGSVETIRDATGTYVKPTALPPNASILTTGADEILALPGDQIVFGTAETLNVSGFSTMTGGLGSDSLSGGGGYDVLSLSGAGNFNLAGVFQLDGFEEVRLTNATLSAASLALRPNTELTVTLSDGSSAPASPNAPTQAGSISVALSNARVTVNGGNESDTILATASTFVAGSQLNGGGGFDQLLLRADFGQSSDAIFDLASIGLRQVESVSVSGTGFIGPAPYRTIVLANNATLADVQTVSLTGNAKLSTAEANFDLRGKLVATVPNVATSAADGHSDSRFPGIISTNTGGTTFTVDVLSTALAVQGGAGNDTLLASTLTLNQAQRDQIFAGSVETIQDATGTYRSDGTATPTPPTTGGGSGGSNPPPLTPSLGSDAGDSLSGSAGSDFVILLGGDDRYIALEGDDLVYGNAGNDEVYGNQGNDTLWGGMGQDSLFGGQGNDYLSGDFGDDLLFGNIGQDLILGGMGADTLYGGQGDDSIYGGQGNDVLSGDLGDDVLSGDLGADRYVFGANSGRDVILGFSQMQGDRIDLQGQTYALSSAADGSAVLRLSGGGTVQLAGIQASAVAASFFA